MSSALLLIAYAVAATTLGPMWLQRSAWTYRAPGLGILAWLALSVGVVLAVALALVSITLGSASVSSGLAEFLHTCVTSVRRAYASPWGGAASIVAPLVLASMLGRLTWSIVHGTARGYVARRAKVRSIDLLGKRGVVPDALVLEHTTSYAFCVPGRHHRIVLTSAAVQTLSDVELGAVVAHERAHIAGRHHWIIAVPRGLARAFPFIQALGIAAAEVAVLVELLADDTARRIAGSAALRRALRSLAELPAENVVLAASARGVERRLNRLASPAVPAHRLPGLLAVSGSLLLLLLPLSVLAAPAVGALADVLCIIN